jgi:hypothetical protein
MNTTNDDMIRTHVPWREMSPARRIFSALLLAGWITGGASLLTLGGIETVALKQPREPIGLYQHPRQIKGAIRYFTDTQDWILGIAHPILIVSFVWFFLSAAGYETVRRQDYTRRKQALFDKVSG